MNAKLPSSSGSIKGDRPLRITYQSIGLTKLQHESFAASIELLCADLMRPPAQLQVNCEALTQPLSKIDLDRLACNAIDLNHWATQTATVQQRLVICCPSDHLLAARAKSANEVAHWGLSWPGMLALVYHFHNGLPQRQIVLHETLHVLGANDCYNPDRLESVCPLHGCIMQYAPAAGNVRPWPYLCESNLERIRQLSRDQ